MCNFRVVEIIQLYFSASDRKDPGVKTKIAVDIKAPLTPAVFTCHVPEHFLYGVMQGNFGKPTTAIFLLQS
jgi:hypothetical protein